MKVAVAAVISLDGKLTRHDEADIHAWVSDEDQEHFASLKQQYKVLIMGTTVYEMIRSQGIKPDQQNLRIVLTHHPETYADEAVTDQLEFHTKTPAELMAYLESKNYITTLIVGGSQMITDFLKAGVVDKLYLTIEPHIFGDGKPLITTKVDINLQLLGQKTLNARGTQLLTYQVA